MNTKQKKITAKQNIADRKYRLKYFALSDELLEIIDHADEFTRSDLQGAVGAFVMRHCMK